MDGILGLLALNNNVPIWINKLRYRGLSTLATHGKYLMGSEGKLMKDRAARGEKLLANREAWNALGMPEKLKWLLHLGVRRSLGTRSRLFWNQRLRPGMWAHMDSRIAETRSLIYSRKVILSYASRTYAFSKKKVAEVKLEIQTLFPQYWVFIATSHYNGRGFEYADGRHYHFTTLTALDSHFFPSATNLTLHPGTSKGPKNKRQPISAGRLLALTTKTKDGGKFNIINLYQFTADKVDDRERV